MSNGSQNKQLNFLDNVFDNIFTDLGASDQAAKKQATHTQDGKKSNDETAAQSDLSKESNEADVTKVPAEILPSAIQTHVGF